MELFPAGRKQMKGIENSYKFHHIVQEIVYHFIFVLYSLVA